MSGIMLLRISVIASGNTLFPPVNEPTAPPREVWLCTLENGKN